MNGDILSLRYKNDTQLAQFCQDHNLLVSQKLPPDPTYHFSDTIRSRIDLVITPQSQADTIKSILTDSQHPLNTSRHNAIIIQTSRSPPTPPAPLRLRNQAMYRFPHKSNGIRWTRCAISK